MLRSQQKLLAVACLLLLLVAGGLATAFGFRISIEMERQFHSRAELFARTFSDQVQFRLAQNEDDVEALKNSVVQLVQDRVRGEVIYAQAVQNGNIIAEQRIYVVGQTQLVFNPDENWLLFSQHTLPSGVPYLDVRRALGNSPQLLDPNSYVRLGFSLVSLQHEILIGALQIAGWSAGGALFAMGLLLLLFKWWYVPAGKSQTPLATAATQAPQTTTAVAANESSTGRNNLLQVGDLSIDDQTKSVCLNQETVLLSPREYELLRLLTSQPGRIFSNDEIVKEVWNDDQYAIPQDVKKYIYLLRKKLETDPSHPKRLLTVRGFGYKLVEATDHLTSFDSS